MGNPKRKRQRMQYTLRTLFIAVLATSVGISWLAMKVQDAREEKATVEMLRRGGVSEYYLHDSKPGQDAEPPGPRWLRRLLGDEFFLAGKPVMVATAGQGDVFQVATSLWALEDLSLTRGQIDDADLVHLRAFRELESLWLDGQERITAEGLRDLRDIPSLRSLSLTNCRISENLIECITGLNQLEELDFEGSSLSDADMRQVACMRRLEGLNVSRMELPAAALPSIGQLTHLKRLDLNQTTVSDAGMRELLSLQQLEELGLSETKVTDAGLLSLSGLPNLRLIYVMLTPITEDGIAAFRRRAPSVRLFH